MDFQGGRDYEGIGLIGAAAFRLVIIVRRSMCGGMRGRDMHHSNVPAGFLPRFRGYRLLNEHRQVLESLLIRTGFRPVCPDQIPYIVTDFDALGLLLLIRTFRRSADMAAVCVDVEAR